MISYVANTKAKKKGGGTYDAWELAYRSEDNELKVITKPVQGLRFNPALAGGLNDLVAGDTFTMTMEQENGYWTPKSVVKGYLDGASAPSSGSNVSVVRSNITPKSTYETPEERAKKQVIITRLATLNAAVATHAQIGNPNPKGDDKPTKVSEIIKTAREYEKYAMEGYNNEVLAKEE